MSSVLIYDSVRGKKVRLKVQDEATVSRMIEILQGRYDHLAGLDLVFVCGEEIFSGEMTLVRILEEGGRGDSTPIILAERGVDGGKLKIGLDMTADLRRIGIMRDALSVASPRPQLMIDVNEYWSPKQAVRFMHEIEKHYDITWIEEPARRWDYEGLSQVSRQIKAAVATAENLKSIGEVYPLIHNQAVDIINVSTATSGFTGCRQVAHLAYAYELPVSMMNCQANYMAHLAAALPNHLAMEVVDPGREHCLYFDNYIEDGFIVLGDKPGLGIEVNEQKLRNLQDNPPGRKSNFPFARREGAGVYVKGVEEGEVPWK